MADRTSGHLASVLRVSALHHLGVAVASIAASRAVYEQVLGLVCVGEEEVADQKVRVAMFQPPAMPAACRIELLEPLADDSPIARHLQRRGPGQHHVAFAVDDLAADLQRLARHGVRLIDEKPRRGAHGMLIAFVHPASAGGVLLELCEPQRP